MLHSLCAQDNLNPSIDLGFSPTISYSDAPEASGAGLSRNRCHASGIFYNPFPWIMGDEIREAGQVFGWLPRYLKFLFGVGGRARSREATGTPGGKYIT